MGDRGNIHIITESGGDIWLYAHWDRWRLASITAKALERGRSRWGDGPYLARMIFCELVKGDVRGETGFGLDTQQGDGDETVRVDMRDQTVTDASGVTRMFEQYVATTPASVISEQ